MQKYGNGTCSEYMKRLAALDVLRCESCKGKGYRIERSEPFFNEYRTDCIPCNGTGMGKHARDKELGKRGMEAYPAIGSPVRRISTMQAAQVTKHLPGGNVGVSLIPPPGFSNCWERDQIWPLSDIEPAPIKE